MSNKTLLEIYKERKSLPTPAMNFIRELSQVTHRSVLFRLNQLNFQLNQ